VSSADVRGIIAGFFQSASIPGLNKVFPAPPYWADGSLWDLNLQTNSGAIAALHIVEEQESRLTVPAIVGSKMVHYELGLMVFYQYLQPQAIAAKDESAWSAPLDIILDGIKARLRSDPQAGVPGGAVWQSAQDRNDVRIRRDLPRTLPGKILSWNVVEFAVDEIIEA
jgi:hypothetical protein